MKKIMSLVMCSLIVANLFGCADKGAYNQYTEVFNSNANAYYEAAKAPLMDMKLPAPDGKEYHLVVNREIKPLVPQQIKDSEWTGAVTAGIVGATTLGLGVTRYYVTKSDNEAAVDMRRSDNEAATAQLRDYVQSFNKETYIEKFSENTTTSVDGATQLNTKLFNSLNENSLNP
jgi:hypothetical protein